MINQHNAPFVSPVMNDSRPQIRLIAFAERPAQEKSHPILLQVYVINDSSTNLEILNDLDSINIPQDLQQGSETVHDVDLIHIDFGVSGTATFIQVAPGECLKIILLLREEQLALLQRVKYMKTAVKFRDGVGDKGEVTTMLLSAMVHKTNP
jgi:hypothetical protein